MDLIINHETDDDILDDDNATLASVGIGPLPSFSPAPFPARAFVIDASARPCTENESEISFFNRALYDEYKANPQQAW